MKVRRTLGVVFDLDGTLYHLPRMRLRLGLMLLSDLGILRHFNASRNAVRTTTFSDGEELAQCFAEDLGRRAGIAPDRALRWYREVFLGAFVSLLDRRAWPRPGLLPFLSRLRAHGVRLGVASDVGRVEQRLRALGIPPEAFDDLVEAETLGALKPSPKALLSLCERWGLEPDRVAMIGDRPDRDGEAAVAAGVPYILIDNTPSPRWRRGHRSKRFQVLPWTEATFDLLNRTGVE